jgi:hypothetical protein
MARSNLKIVKPEPSLEDEIRLALIQHKQALESVRWAEDELQPLRRRYAAERGEFMLPSIERLRREIGA